MKRERSQELVSVAEDVYAQSKRLRKCLGSWPVEIDQLIEISKAIHDLAAEERINELKNLNTTKEDLTSFLNE